MVIDTVAAPNHLLSYYYYVLHYIIYYQPMLLTSISPYSCTLKIKKRITDIKKCTLKLDSKFPAINCGMTLMPKRYSRVFRRESIFRESIAASHINLLCTVPALWKFHKSIATFYFRVALRVLFNFF